jgi:hypothetical protein
MLSKILRTRDIILANYQPMYYIPTYISILKNLKEPILVYNHDLRICFKKEVEQATREPPVLSRKPPVL